MGDARQYVTVEGEFPMYRGGRLLGARVAYETWGELNASADNAVLIFTGLSPPAHAASNPRDTSPGWWEEIIGPGRPIDTGRWFVVCVNSLGSCFGSTGPASEDPETGAPYRLGFPVLSLEDVARGGYEVIRHLGVRRVHATVGPSMGGMTSLAFEMLFPGMSRGLVIISSGAHSLPFSTAMRSLQRDMIRRDPDWDGGNYPRANPPLMGMRMARKLGMITYRSAEEWRTRFARKRVAEQNGGDGFGPMFEVETYLEHHANKFIGQFDPNCYLYLSRASDLFDVAEHAGGSVDAALSRVEAERVRIIGVKTDFLFPFHQQEELARGLDQPGRQVELVALDSIQGHDSFLVDMERFRPAIGDFFA